MEADPFPKEFYCPITQEIMQNPVIGPDGQTYERQSIEDWLRVHNTSPVTRAPMQANQLIPNFALKNAIQNMLNGKTIPKAKIEPMEMPEKVIDNIDLNLQTMDESDDTGILHIQVVPPKDGKRKPTAIICLVDTSGSMQQSASQEHKGEMEGFCVLDLIKHSVNTVINMLDPCDFLGVISFSDSAKTAIGLTPMNEMGKKLAMEAVDKLVPENTTNIWDALRIAIMMTASDPICKDINVSWWLFTDGMPNLNPPRGVVDTLSMFLEDKNREFTINTFGFGYELDSRLLYNVANLQNGVFCYLPDSNLIGTTFVNCLCNTLSTSTNRCVLEIKGEEVKDLHCIGYPMKDNKIEVGNVQYGQTRDFAIRYQKSKFGAPKFKVTMKHEGKEVNNSITGTQTADPDAIFRTMARSMYAEILIDGLDNRRDKKADTSFITKLKNYVKSLPNQKDAFIIAILKDLDYTNEAQGRVEKAFTTPERINRWGKHYVRSIIRAHQMQQCHNFKDPGVQLYGGKLFKTLQFKADMMFCSLPPPVPTIKRIQAALKAQEEAKAAAPPAPAMNEYMDYGGGCFDGDGLVKLTNGQFKKVRDLLKGDEIISENGLIAKIECLVKFPINHEMPMVCLNGLYLTTKHPVLNNGIWTYPKNIEKPTMKFMDAIYNLVLSCGHVAEINGISVVTLGHNKHDNKIVSHMYYGTNRIIEDLRRFADFKTGFINMEKSKKLKDPLTGHVMHLISQ